MTVVQIEKPEDTKLADWFAELRLWFDNNDCNPILFTEVGEVKNRSGFNIKFADDVQARLFASNFAKYEPTILRLIGGKPSKVKEDLDLAGVSEKWKKGSC
jgi:hypothetical protein